MQNFGRVKMTPILIPPPLNLQIEQEEHTKSTDSNTVEQKSWNIISELPVADLYTLGGTVFFAPHAKEPVKTIPVESISIFYLTEEMEFLNSMEL